MDFRDKIIETQLIRKAAIAENLGANSFEKGGKTASIGEVRTHGGKQMVKTVDGWKPVQKTSAQNQRSSQYPPKIQKVLDKIDPKVSKWSEADDTARDIVGKVRALYNEANDSSDENHEKHHASLDWRAVAKKGPGAWNRSAHDEIRIIWNKADEKTKKFIIQNL